MVMWYTFLSMVFYVYSYSILKNKYEVILYSHNLLFPFKKIQDSHVSKCPPLPAIMLTSHLYFCAVICLNDPLLDCLRFLVNHVI